MTRTLTRLVMAAFVVLAVSACGKEGPPEPPSEDSTFPRTYPSQ